METTNIIIKNENVRIKKENNIYELEFKTPNYALMNSLLKTRIIQGASTDETYKRLFFKANEVKTLKQYKLDKKKATGKHILSVSDTANLIRSLVIQLNYLIEIETHVILGYNPEEVIVINDTKFAYIGSELVTKIDEDTSYIMISCPYSTKDFFFSPELLAIKEIPSYIHFKTSYFSLGLLIIYVLLEDNEFYTQFTNNNNNEIEIYKDQVNYKTESFLLSFLNNHPIKNSKLFWLLSRCLVEEAKDRCIILL
jgi:hypothetical protein